jgi:hypothetical protein
VGMWTSGREEHFPQRNIGSPAATPKTIEAVNSSLVP